MAPDRPRDGPIVSAGGRLKGGHQKVARNGRGITPRVEFWMYDGRVARSGRSRRVNVKEKVFDKNGISAGAIGWT
jgi:hypothetical protein